MTPRDDGNCITINRPSMVLKSSTDPPKTDAHNTHKPEPMFCVLYSGSSFDACSEVHGGEGECT